ncbi:two-partner secretion domain-containing protein [Alkalinema pantanalense]|uniref:two-partner secretion domain-containing protein n=1 Tax=Alkalinema pantanalense TaxID=1620705 RepID=UPI003D6FDC61
MPDGTLGSQASMLTTSGTIDTVQGGLQIGNHLFHSFSSFNINVGRSVIFRNPGVRNILTRVTGTQPSQINGLLQVEGNANLFFINPNGIHFGMQARLNIAGAFNASTTSAIAFSDGSQFSATQPTVPNVLTIAVPLGLQLGNQSLRGTISQQGLLETEQDLTLMADRLEIQGQLKAGRDLTLLANRLQVGATTPPDPDQPALAQAGGNLSVQSDVLNISGSGKLRTLNTVTGQDSLITLGKPDRPIDQIIISGIGSGIFTSAPSNLSPQAATTNVNSNTNANANINNIDLISNQGGNINIFANGLSVVNQGQINTGTTGSRNAGHIMAQVKGLIQIDSGEIATGVGAHASGQAGTIQLTAGSLVLTQRGQIRSNTSGQGNAGDIDIQAETVMLRDGRISSGSGTRDLIGGPQPRSFGAGGSINLQANSLTVTESGILSATTFTNGKGGNINVTAATVALTNRGQISATTESTGDAGSIMVNARDRMIISDAPSGIFANTGFTAKQQATGQGGSIFVNTGELLMENRARITVDSQGLGQGGEIQLVANRLTLTNQATIFAETASTQGGNITINAQDFLLLRRNSLISASAGTAQAGGDGGNIQIRSGFVVGPLPENSDIIANAFTGNGGQIQITAQGVFGLQFQPQVTPLSDITANSRFGNSGTVFITTLTVDPSRGLVALPSEIADSTNQIAQTCSAQQLQNRFVILGRGGLSPDRTESLNQTLVWTDSTMADQSLTSTASPAIARSEIVEMTGWVHRADGTIDLVSDRGRIEDSQATQQTGFVARSLPAIENCHSHLNSDQTSSLTRSPLH